MRPKSEFWTFWSPPHGVRPTPVRHPTRRGRCFARSCAKACWPIVKSKSTWPSRRRNWRSWALPAWEMTEQLRGMFGQMGQSKRQQRKLQISEAMKLLTDEEAAKLVNDDDIKTQALQMLEQNGIVFIDEIDKVTSRSEGNGAEVSRQGVQRDLLPLVEGTSVSTKYGVVKTDHILFIASGAFHLSKPSDLIPELQGRFPIRVELQSLSVQDFEAILTQTHASLVKQYQALLETEQVTLDFR